MSGRHCRWFVVRDAGWLINADVQRVAHLKKREMRKFAHVSFYSLFFSPGRCASSNESFHIPVWCLRACFMKQNTRHQQSAVRRKRKEKGLMKKRKTGNSRRRSSARMRQVSSLSYQCDSCLVIITNDYCRYTCSHCSARQWSEEWKRSERSLDVVVFVLPYTEMKKKKKHTRERKKTS